MSQNIIFQYVVWQFADAPKAILAGWKNFLKFGLYYFSAPLLLKTLFSPWRRFQWGYPKGLSMGKGIEAFFSNLISRILGLILRTFLVLFWAVFEIFIIFAGLAILASWLILPFLLLAGLLIGFKILF
ncbi:MAG: hypothetical protein V1705_01980 [bacterium]